MGRSFTLLACSHNEIRQSRNLALSSYLSTPKTASKSHHTHHITRTDQYSSKLDTRPVLLFINLKIHIVRSDLVVPGTFTSDRVEIVDACEEVASSIAGVARGRGSMLLLSRRAGTGEGEAGEEKSVIGIVDMFVMRMGRKCSIGLVFCGFLVIY